ncbi:MAG: hypothetical protein JXA25_13705 [Anaerolineales bacterium]|nr:hypothetical protein [Anaerolineales bacterium]
MSAGCTSLPADMRPLYRPGQPLPAGVVRSGIETMLNMHTMEEWGVTAMRDVHSTKLQVPKDSGLKFMGTDIVDRDSLGYSISAAPEV